MAYAITKDAPRMMPPPSFYARIGLYFADYFDSISRAHIYSQFHVVMPFIHYFR